MRVLSSLMQSSSRARSVLLTWWRLSSNWQRTGLTSLVTLHLAGCRGAMRRKGGGQEPDRCTIHNCFPEFSQIGSKRDNFVASRCGEPVQIRYVFGCGGEVFCWQQVEDRLTPSLFSGDNAYGQGNGDTENLTLAPRIS